MDNCDEESDINQESESDDNENDFEGTNKKAYSSDKVHKRGQVLGFSNQHRNMSEKLDEMCNMQNHKKVMSKIEEEDIGKSSRLYLKYK